MFVIAFGNAWDGMTLTGPFDDHDVALAYAERHADDTGEWNIVELETPGDVNE